MASIELAENSVVEEDLTYGELEDLLQQAEVRLRGESSTLSLVQANVPVVQSVKKSKTASLPAPAVSMKGRVAQARPETLVSQDDQRLALQGIRKVEDPIMLKRKQLKVRMPTLLCCRILHDENLPNVFLERDLALHSGARLQNESRARS